MKKKPNIKKTILKKIEDRRNQYIFIDKRKNNKSNMSDNISSNIKSHLDGINKNNRVNDRTRMRIGDNTVKNNVNIDYQVNKLIENNYKKKIFVDYDIVICIPSYDRYEKVKRLITQFYEQLTKYTFKIILLNDGSDDRQYDELYKLFPEIIYIKNEKPNGKILHWYCYSQMWEYLKNIECYTVLQMDDDFIICDNFLDTVTDIYFNEKLKNNNVLAIAPHLWSFNKISRHEIWWKSKNFVDGIAMIDDNVIKYMNYEMKIVDAIAISKVGAPVRAWTQISDAIKNIGGIVHRTENSLVYHDGNEDSKLHVGVRGNGKGVFTQKIIESLKKNIND